MIQILNNMDKLKDNQIRKAIVKSLKGHILLHEFTFMSNNTIADILDVTSDKITSYEIKSDYDSYARLPNQIIGYNSVCSFKYIVIGASKESSIYNHIPDDYGIIVASSINNKIELTTIRKPIENKNIQVEPMIEWLPSTIIKSIAKAQPIILAKYDNKKTQVNKTPKHVLIQDILSNMRHQIIIEEVMTYLKSDGLATKRDELKGWRDIIKNKEKASIDAEYGYRISNFQYWTEDLKLAQSSKRWARLKTLDSYLPLSLYNKADHTYRAHFDFDESESIVLVFDGNPKLSFPAEKRLFDTLEQSLINKDPYQKVLFNLKLKFK